MGNYKQNNNKLNTIVKEQISKKREFTLLKNEKKYSIEIILNNNEIFIKSLNYQKTLNIEGFYKYFDIKLITMEEAYNFIINLFIFNKVIIKDISNDNEIILILTIFDNKLKIYRNIELILLNTENTFYNKDPNNIHFLNTLSSNAYSCYSVDKTFIVFKAKNKISYLIFASEDVSIICFSLNSERIVTEIKNAHEREYITNLSHCYQEKNNMDILMSVSGDNNNIKLWNISNWKCILNITNINQIGFLESACILNFKNEFYIISSNWNYEDVEKIKVYDFKGNKIKEIANSDEKTYFINTFYDTQQSTYYIIAGNYNYLKSYNYEKNKLFQKYYENNNNGAHLSAIIFNNENITQLVESCVDGFIRIWNFHTGKILNKIDTTTDNFIGIFGICIWNKKYLFTSCNNNEIKLIDLENKTIVKRLKGHKKPISCIRKIIHPKYGECLISQGYKNDQLKLWTI